jgi:hypothetical protein
MVSCIIFVQPLSHPSMFTRSVIGPLWISSLMLSGTALLLPSQNRNNAMRFDLMAIFLKRNIGGIDPTAPNSGVNGLEEKPRSALPAEAQYACRYWAPHVLRVEHGDVAVMQTLEMFSMKMILWFEGMNLIGSIPVTAGSINAVFRWAVSTSLFDAAIYCFNIFHDG